MATLPSEFAMPASPRLGRRAGIVSIGACVPAGILTNAQLETMVETSDTWIMERTGIRQRHRTGSGETASTIGAAAARDALDRAGNPRVDVIIAATCSPDTLIPSVACLIQRQLDMGGIPAFDINAACSGFVYGLSVAEGLIGTGVAETILVVATEAMTSLVDYGDRTTCVLFGDGAGAAVVQPTDRGGIVARRWGADGGEADLIYFGPPPGGSAEDPDALRMAGRGTYRLAVERLCTIAEQLCADAGWTLDEVQHFIPHQANLRIIEASAKRLGVPMERVVVNVDEVGNTSAASIPLALESAVRASRLRDGDKVLAVAFGAGATWGGVAFEWDH
ncbi:MAG: beta-ketoacyl-ACP synthase III [Candidatus Dormibacteria bacterium]